MPPTRSAAILSLGLVGYLAARSEIAGPPVSLRQAHPRGAGTRRTNLIVHQSIADQLESMRTITETIVHPPQREDRSAVQVAAARSAEG